MATKQSNQIVKLLNQCKTAMDANKEAGETLLAYLNSGGTNHKKIKQLTQKVTDTNDKKEILIQKFQDAIKGMKIPSK